MNAVAAVLCAMTFRGSDLSQFVLEFGCWDTLYWLCFNFFLLLVEFGVCAICNSLFVGTFQL